MATTIQAIGIGLPAQMEANREAFARAVKAAFNNGADRVELVDGARPIGWISADGCAHYQPISDG